MDNEKIGLVIKTLRKKAGLTQKQLATALNVTDKAVSKWERGIGIPGISMINQLADILNIDADNLLAGNIAYLENEWSGELRLDKFDSEISITTEVYGKPSVYFYFCYFALAGIKKIYITCSEEDRQKMDRIVESGEKFGLELHYNEKTAIKKTMSIDGPIFLYGPNLTKYFQRGMAHENTKTNLAIPHGGEELIYLDGKHQISDITENKQGYRVLPIHFINGDCRKVEYEPLGKGMICIDLKSTEDVLAASNLIQIVEKYSGNQVYCLAEIALRRGLIDAEQLRKIAGASGYLLGLANGE